MPKLKTNRGAAKRFTKTANGGYKSKHSHLRHILTKKSTSRKRSLRSPDSKTLALEAYSDQEEYF